MPKEFDKVVHPGRDDDGEAVFCHIQFKNDRLSITGVVGPRKNGNCRGSCGQIGQENVVRPAEGWTTETLNRFWMVWKRFHLNDMRSGCEHQRRADWGNDKVEVVTYKLTTEAYTIRKKALDKAAKAGLDGEPAKLDETERALASLEDWYADQFTPPDADSPLSGCYEVRKRETKLTTWVKPSEHPKGVLCKPCPECGYKYGSAWLFEAVCESALAWLRSLPETPITPAWV